jgi:hypothetical protein
MEIKKTLHDIFVFNSNSPQIKHIAKTNTSTKRKNSMRGPQINQRRPPNIFEIVWYRKGARLAEHQTRMGIKIMVKA